MADAHRLRRHAGIVATALALAACLAICLQCTGSILENAADAGPQDCPSNPPSVGAACSLPNDQECSYKPDCGCCFNNILNCVQGVWVHQSINGKPPRPSCPDTIPEPGAMCEPECGSQTCLYACGAIEAGVSATCTDMGWQMSFDACDAAPMDVDDAGADADAADGD